LPLHEKKRAGGNSPVLKQPLLFLIHPCSLQRHMLTKSILWTANKSIEAINATLADQDPYNHQYPDPSNWCSLRDCEFPDEVEDPLELIRLLRGDTVADQLEYEDNLEHIAHVLNECFKEALLESGFQSNQLSDDDDESGDEDPEDGHSDCAFLAGIFIPC
jgi:hypothetical protein